MRTRTRVAVVAALIGGLVASASPARAGHHLWKFTQIFSNAAGSVQFAQLFTTDAGENGVGPFTITTDTGHTFNFVTSPTGSTANTWILVATSNFAGLPGGVMPDYIIPANFFSTGGGSLNYAGVDTWSYGTVPTDGVRSLMRDGTTPTNSPKNFAGQSGSVNLATATPALPRWGIILLVGCMLVAASGLLRKLSPSRLSAS